MKKLKKIHLKETEIIDRLSNGEMQKLIGGGYGDSEKPITNCLACGGQDPHPACIKCQA